MKSILFLIIFFISTSSQPTPQGEFDYYPLTTGNYFEYFSRSWEYPFYNDSSFSSMTVLGDTVMENGKNYKTLYYQNIFNSHSHYEFQRIDSTDGSVYKYSNYEKLENHEFKIDSLFAEVGDTIYCSLDFSTKPELLMTIVDDIRIDTVLGVETEIKILWDISSLPGYAYEMAKGFGFVDALNCEFGCGSTTLVYAQVDGVTYGDKITLVQDDENEIPNNYYLSQNYPNPFNPSTKIKFTIPTSPFNPSPYQGEGNRERLTSIIVYDILGREIKTLVNENLLPGNYEIEFDGSDLASGVYFYNIKSGSFFQSRKMLLLK